MLEVLQRSWVLTKLTFRVMAQDKEMLLFPLLAGVSSLVLAAALLVPTVLSRLASAGGQSVGALGALDYLLLAATYFGLAFIATFFNVCVVHTTKARFEGSDATFTDSLRFALSRVPLIAAWSAVAATVGLVLRALHRAAERAGGTGELVLGVLTSVLGMAWTVVTLFVVPGMVYRGLGPLAAIRDSVAAVRRTWGESLVRHFGLGVVEALFLVLGAGMAYVLLNTLGGLGTAGVVAAVGVSAVYFLGVVLVFQVAKNVFNTALYAYANDLALPATFDEDTLRHAFRRRHRRPLT